jgi:glycosyltransferase involved in cell wall biosynthesis
VTRLRVATIFTELGIGGDEHRVLHFGRHLDRSRFEHVVLTFVAPDARQEARIGPIAASYHAAGIRCVSLDERRRADLRALPQPFSALRDGGRTLRLAARLARRLRRERIDVVDARMVYNMVVGLLAARLAGARAVATEYWNDWWGRAPWRWVAPAVFDGFDAVVSDSRYTLDRYRAALGRPLAHGVVVPNGVPVPEPARDRAAVRRELRIPPAAPVVAQVARLVPAKGQRELLAAAALVRRARPEVWFLVVGYDAGDGAYTARLHAEARALGVADRVRITPWPGPIADVWGAVDVHVHASLLDSSPIAIHESMAIGLPLVATTAGGIPELVEHERTGLLVPPGDPAALAAALLRVLDEPATAARLADGARRRHRARPRPEQMARALEDVFAGVAAGRTAG